MIVEGELVLVTDAGEQPMRPGRSLWLPSPVGPTAII